MQESFTVDHHMTSTPIEKATKHISLPRKAKSKPLSKSFFDDDDDDEIEILSDDDDKQVSDSSESQDKVNRINFFRTDLFRYYIVWD